MDFVSDSLTDGRSFRALAIVDRYTRECPVIEIDVSLPGARVLRVLEQLVVEQIRHGRKSSESSHRSSISVFRYLTRASLIVWRSYI
jgi:transposase InsO family protein